MAGIGSHYSTNIGDGGRNQSEMDDQRGNNGGPLRALLTANKGAGSMRLIKFPLGLDQIDHWITFRAYATKQLNRGESSQSYPITNIALPIPGNLSTGYKLNYPGTNLTALGDEAMNIATGQADAVPGWKKLVEEGKGFADETKNFKEKLNLIAAGAKNVFQTGVNALEVGAAVGLATAAAKDGITAGALASKGVAANPHKVIMFESVDLKSHSFSYKFFPQSYEEAKVLRDVISLFKYHAAPSYLRMNPAFGGGDILRKHFFKYPEYWELDFHHPEFLFQIGTSVLSSVEVDYHEKGVPSYARNGEFATPTAVELKLRFDETSIVTKEDIEGKNR